MCTGFEIPALLSQAAPGIAMSLAGSAINANIANQAIKRQNQENQRAMDMERSAREAETQRQRAMEQEQADRVAKALTQTDTEAQSKRVAEEVASPDNEIVNAVDAYNLMSLPGQIANGGEIGRIVSDAVKRTRDILKSAATLTAQDRAALGVQDELVRMGGDISNVGSRRQGSINVANMETRVPAATVTRSPSIIGDALLLAGQGLAGRAGQSAGFGAAPAYVRPTTLQFATGGSVY